MYVDYEILFWIVIEDIYYEFELVIDWLFCFVRFCIIKGFLWYSFLNLERVKFFVFIEEFWVRFEGSVWVEIWVGLVYCL